MSPDAVLAVLGGACGSMLTIAAFTRFVARPLWRGWRRVDAFLEDWNGEPARPGRPARPSMPQRVTSLEDDMAAIKQQVTPNGGETELLGDRVVRIGEALGTERAQR